MTEVEGPGPQGVPRTSSSGALNGTPAKIETPPSSQGMVLFLADVDWAIEIITISLLPSIGDGCLQLYAYLQFLS